MKDSFDRTLRINQRLAGMQSKELRQFDCWCVRHVPLPGGRTVWDLLTTECRQAVEVAERYSVGKATMREMTAAYEIAKQVFLGLCRSAKSATWEESFLPWALADAASAAVKCAIRTRKAAPPTARVSRTVPSDVLNASAVARHVGWVAWDLANNTTDPAKVAAFAALNEVLAAQESYLSQ